MPNLAAYGISIPTFVLICTSLRYRDPTPLAVLALVGVFSVHITGGVVTVLVVAAWWPLDALWLLLIASIVHSSAPFGGPIGALTGKFSDLFYSDPRRLSAVVALLLIAIAGIAAVTSSARSTTQ